MVKGCAVVSCCEYRGGGIVDPVKRNSPATAPVARLFFRQAGGASLGLNRAFEVVRWSPRGCDIARSGGGEHRRLRRQDVRGYVPRHRVKLPMPAVVARHSRNDAYHALLPRRRRPGEAVEVVGPLLRGSRGRHDGSYHLSVVIAAAD